MRPIIYHNPNCGTSRNTLAMLLASGENPEVIEYLNAPYTRELLVELIQQMQISLRDLLRRNVAPYDELQLDNPEFSDDQLIDFMVQHPILVNRPIVVTDKGAKLCRPSETVLTLLENPVVNFQKESVLLAKLKQLHNHYVDQANEYNEYVQRNEDQQFHDDYTLAVADTTDKFVQQLAALINEFEAKK